MIIRPRINPRERILAIGTQGVGKSNAILTLAQRNTDDTFYVIDNDMSFEVLVAEQYPELDNVEVTYVDAGDWQGHLDAISTIKDKMDKDDWLVIDMMTATWQAVQTWFTEQIFGQALEDYFLEVRKMKQTGKQGGKDKALGAFEGFMDWPVINSQYNKIYTAILNTPGHVYATAEVATVSDDDDKDIRGIFGPYGVKPKGQKRMGHVFSTVLLYSKSRVGEYAMTSIKQRGREEFEDVPFEDWSKDYLMKYARWRPAKSEKVKDES